MGDDKTRREAEVKELQATIDKWDKQIKDGNVADLVKEWQSPNAYAADGYRLVAANPNICTKCHSIGGAENRERQWAGLEHRFRAFAAGMDVRVDQQSGSDVRVFANNAAEFPARFGRL